MINAIVNASDLLMIVHQVAFTQSRQLLLLLLLMRLFLHWLYLDVSLIDVILQLELFDLFGRLSQRIGGKLVVFLKRKNIVFRVVLLICFGINL